MPVMERVCIVEAYLIKDLLIGDAIFFISYC